MRWRPAVSPPITLIRSIACSSPRLEARDSSSSASTDDSPSTTCPCWPPAESGSAHLRLGLRLLDGLDLDQVDPGVVRALVLAHPGLVAPHQEAGRQHRRHRTG